jgi:hypothetical protein
MKLWQNFITSKSDFPLGSKSEPPFLEDLLESEELEDTEVDRGMESQATLVWSYRAVELDAISFIYLHFAFVVKPGHPEEDNSFRLDNPVEYSLLSVNRFSIEDDSDTFNYLAYSLMECILPGILLDNFCYEISYEIRHMDLLSIAVMIDD